jgi:hypothetical protein
MGDQCEQQPPVSMYCRPSVFLEGGGGLTCREREENAPDEHGPLTAVLYVSYRFHRAVPYNMAASNFFSFFVFFR